MVITITGLVLTELSQEMCPVIRARWLASILRIHENMIDRDTCIPCP